MGSLFSSPAAAAAAAAGDGRPPHLLSLIPKPRCIPRNRLGRTMTKEMKANLDQGHDGRVFTKEELYAECIRWFAYGVLKHYNANNPGAEYQCPAESTMEMKAACTGFRKDFVWYHLNFSAHRTDNKEEMYLFFAELCYDIGSLKTNLETCTILEKPLRSSCAFCPEKSKIMHPSELEFVCGKEWQRAEFFRLEDMLLWPWHACTGDLDLSDGPQDAA